MAGKSSTVEPAPLPERLSLKALREASAGCRACELWANATQTVFGEQPGDREDREGAPFVGPAGQLLDRGLAQAAIPRDDAYLTNVVKHFRTRPRGKRRIHQRRAAEHIAACPRGSMPSSRSSSPRCSCAPDEFVSDLRVVAARLR